VKRGEGDFAIDGESARVGCALLVVLWLLSNGRIPQLLAAFARRLSARASKG
jgi:hypothetical protein